MNSLNKSAMLLLFVFLSILLTAGCGNRNYNGAISETTKEGASMIHLITDMGDYTYMEGVFSDRAWDENLIEEINSNPSSPSNTVSTAEQAISLAIVEFEKHQQAGYCKSYHLDGVFYDIDDQVWIVWFVAQAESDNMIVLGNCYSIAISKNNGQVLNAWPGE